MADPAQEAAVQELYDQLSKHIKNEQHKKALKAAEAILELNKRDEDAARCKAVALMQLEEWQQALNCITAAGLKASMAFEQAYCLYRLERLDQGLAALQPLLAQDVPAPAQRPAVELAAQLHYRQGRGKDCITLYDSLLKQNVASLQLKSNVLAAHVAAGQSQQVPDLLTTLRVSAKDGYEVGYNKACGLLDLGQWAAAETELKLARRIGQEALDLEGCSGGEVEEELAPLTVQLAYTLGRLGRPQEAQDIYDTVLRSKQELGDEPTRAVAVNNSFADCGRINGQASNKKTVAGAARKLEALLADASKPGAVAYRAALEVRLSAAQKRLLTLNRALLYLLAGRMEPARELADQLAKQEQQHPQAAAGSQHLLPLLQAALLVRYDKVAEADALLASCAPGSPAAALHIGLARVQLALERDHTAQAAQLLSGLDSTAVQAGIPPEAILTTRVSLLQQLGEHAAAEAVLEGMLQSARQQGPGGRGAAAGGLSPPALAWCLESLVGLKLRQGKLQEALATHSQLQALGTKTASAAVVLCRLVRCVAGSEAQASAVSLTQLTRELPSFSADIAGLDVDLLEGAAAAGRGEGCVDASGGKRSHQDMDLDPGQQAQDAVSKAKRGSRKKAKRKPRLPKGYNPALPNGGLPPPDPERWLPKWQRTDFKKKKLKSSAREKGAVKGSQGAGKVDESLDRTKADASSKPGPSKPTLPAKPNKKKK